MAAGKSCEEWLQGRVVELWGMAAGKSCGVVRQLPKAVREKVISFIHVLVLVFNHKYLLTYFIFYCVKSSVFAIVS